ncbi:MAG: restriction endonuclease [Bradyrhizobium sp.]|uniref:restriction endonuclease n=1 Tax=Bradyrhizobium sp. TaxID=376 RepID=UPI001C29DD10|nr:restriction endonuclease [Bradyrhizobium sp.]MBU6464903.1 restriction endonuclease [Pseudomonadota bacterium]MDE2068798.1 restriction endonuclease [Bradyrhizobium sp.]MDE2243562.1 restriction endonuclease [Bradyrhizobium sp.]MDE2469425.1 restriction endonuclease [Bradyrhizobium sp.]
MAIPDYQTLMLPVLKLADEGEQRVADVVDLIADRVGLTGEERQKLLPSGRQRVLHNRIHWAKFYLTKAGFLTSPGRGLFAITQAGRELLAENLARIDVSILMRQPGFREFYRNEGVEDSSNAADAAATGAASPGTITPEEQIETAYQTLEATLRGDLLDRIAKNSPTFFEQLIVDLLVAMGYGGSHKNAAAQLGRSGDGGVDGVINEDRLGLDRVYIQAKRYAATNAVGRPDVQAFVGSLVGLGATKGVFVTTSTFSGQAHDFVKHLSQRVVLLDGESLAGLMIEHGIGVRTSRTVEFRRLDEDFFEEA